jgi:hypothetical protein
LIFPVPSHQDILFWKNYNEIILRFLEKKDVDKVLTKMHGPVGGHFVGETITHKILRFSYFWPRVFKDTHIYTYKCNSCQKCDGRENILNATEYFT